VKIPNALLRAEPSSKVALIKLSVLGAASAAPTPWTARVRSSIVDVVAIPPRSDAAVKIRESDDEHSTSPEDVARSTTEEQEASEGQAVGVDDPRESRRTEVQGVLDGHEGDVDDGSVGVRPSTDT